MRVALKGFVEAGRRGAPGVSPAAAGATTCQKRRGRGEHTGPGPTAAPPRPCKHAACTAHPKSVHVALPRPHQCKEHRQREPPQRNSSRAGAPRLRRTIACPWCAHAAARLPAIKRYLNPPAQTQQPRPCGRRPGSCNPGSVDGGWKGSAVGFVFGSFDGFEFVGADDRAGPKAAMAWLPPPPPWTPMPRVLRSRPTLLCKCRAPYSQERQTKLVLVRVLGSEGGVLPLCLPQGRGPLAHGGPPTPSLGHCACLQLHACCFQAWQGEMIFYVSIQPL
jgi:hypothetical protein